MLALCGIAVLTAQTPAPPASSAKPLRHLEYAFSVKEEGMTSYEFNGDNGNVETASGTPNAAGSSSGEGTMSVDVLSVAPDGALVVRIAERMRTEASPRAAHSCNVYGSTSVFCSSPAPSAAEWILLGYLGRYFIDGAPWTADGHWQRTQKSAAFTLQQEFTLVDAGDGKKVVVQELRKMVNGGINTQTSTITINYDRAMGVPDQIRDEVISSGADTASSAHYEFTLLRDSFAKKAH